MGSWPAADADKWWHTLPPARREQIHRMMDREARQEPVPRDQMALDALIEEDPHAA